MLFKERKTSLEYALLKSLSSRMKLHEKDLQYLRNLEKGDEGERYFDSLTGALTCDCFVLNDLRLSCNNATFQIDALMITGETIYLFEVKNDEGNFYYDRDRIFTKNKSEINNPLLQVKRCESLFRQLILSLGFDMPVSASVVFVNPEFTLYQAPLSAPFIFPSQLKRMKDLNAIYAKRSGKHRRLAEKLSSLHIEESPFLHFPKYRYDQLRKGIFCATCGSFSCAVKGRSVICEDCGQAESVEAAVLRSVREFRMLFPERKITTNDIFDWCRIVDSKKRVSRILAKNFNKFRGGRWSYYE
ncbi:nuclease-related domain-containing protein [Heyndrickxia coagulans]|uniref:nuclease-related domain-containing protein n=1 Tax=Heyndrickxia coagulans TaxID=1398 RepID=UPI000E4A5160|nr:nuclease-related domain-containing protein [Heyndrickxia coagulans]RGR82279.1 NERD domain-containing protein [Heyndrickxia coagulans]RGR95884.1 NERD domain-containing protein [Heyndrickxia coagulans]